VKKTSTKGSLMTWICSRRVSSGPMPTGGGEFAGVAVAVLFKPGWGKMEMRSARWLAGDEAWRESIAGIARTRFRRWLGWGRGVAG
jgi:hypothetical protein